MSIECIRGSADTFGVEVRADGMGAVHERGRFQVTFWKRSSGSSLPTTFGDRETAEQVAVALFEVMRPEYVVEQRIADESHARIRRDLDERSERRQAERAKLLAKVTDETPRVVKCACPSCGGEVVDIDEFDEPVYECGGCGSTGRGEDGRRCDQGCGRFRAKIASRSCPLCEAPLEDGDVPEDVVGVVLDNGEFATEADLAGGAS